MSGVSDEYRHVLLAWATEQLEGDTDVRKILDVRVVYSGGYSWSEWTSEDACLHVVVTYEDSNGITQDARLQHEEESAARSLTKMLGELLKLADLRGDEIKAGKTRIADAQARLDASWAEMTTNAEVALFLGDQQVTDWESFRGDGLIVGVRRRNFSADSAVFRNASGEKRVLLDPNGLPAAFVMGSEVRLTRPVVTGVSDV